jgi:hypothetical protein
MTQPATTKTVGQRRPRRRWVAAAVTGFSLITASIVAGAVATPGQILALPGASESTVVTVNPTRVLDTRYNVGLAGQFQSTVSRKLAITGKIPTYVEATATTAAVTTNKVVIPVGATGVIMNVTAVSPTSAGFLSIRPGDATGVPATAGLNFVPGDVVPNAVTVAIPTTGANAGRIDIHYGGAAGNTMHVIIDIVGYTTSTGLIDLVNRVTALETVGVAGPKGDKGDDGAAAVDPAQVVWVATSGGNTFPLLSTALASISDASSSKPYVIRIAPGVYIETSPVELKSYVDVEGSGQGITTITCACGGSTSDELSATVSAGNITAEIRHLTINNTGAASGDGSSIGVAARAVTAGSFSILHVTATATSTGTGSNYGVYNLAFSSPSMLHVTATATSIGTVIGSNSGVRNSQSSSPSMNNVTATATGGTPNYGVYNNTSSPSMHNVTATATGGNTNYGVRNESSSPSMNNVTATGTGTGGIGIGNNYGVRNIFSSSPSMNNVTATATGGNTNYGVDNEASSSPSIRNSSITGTTNSIHNNGSTAKVADTVLDVAVGGDGYTCVGVYTTAFATLGPACV